MADVQKCRKCRYWSGSSGHSSGEGAFKFCHHLLWAGKRRVEVDGVCRSFVRRVKQGCAKEQP